MLELYDGKLSRTVLRRESGSNPADLAGKAIPNALKGIVISDDDQFSLQISLLSTLSARPCCHIYLLPQNAADYFFSLRGSGGL